MQTPTIYNTILCGGSGTRLWPLSRELQPKQFLTFANNESLLQKTLIRSEYESLKTKTLIVCNAQHRFMVEQQLTDVNVSDYQLLLEPCGRNTAPAIAVAALRAQQENPEALMMVMPSDHLITDTTAFHNAVENAAKIALDGKLVVFGIRPTQVETGFGYIHAKDNLNNNLPGLTVEQFVEKPNQQTAQQYIASGEYYWNSGMFMFQASTFLNELKTLAPEIYSACQQALNHTEWLGKIGKLGVNAFTDCPSDSVDYAVFEKTNNVAMVKLDAGWCDLGSWRAMADVENLNEQGNSLIGDVLVESVNNTYIHAESRLVAAIGIEDCVVVETKDAVLISRKDQTQDVKSIVNRLKQLNRDEATSHRQVQRPWGHYESLEDLPGFKVKRIFVKPGASLSLQLHHQRSEHWVVVRGTATVTKDDQTFTLQKNESTYISKEQKHRLSNQTSEKLEIIEVQVGDYLEEDDIIRFDDVYGRVTEKTTS